MNRLQTKIVKNCITIDIYLICGFYYGKKSEKVSSVKKKLNKIKKHQSDNERDKVYINVITKLN